MGTGLDALAERRRARRECARASAHGRRACHPLRGTPGAHRTRAGVRARAPPRRPAGAAQHPATRGGTALSKPAPARCGTPRRTPEPGRPPQRTPRCDITDACSTQTRAAMHQRLQSCTKCSAKTCHPSRRHCARSAGPGSPPYRRTRCPASRKHGRKVAEPAARTMRNTAERDATREPLATRRTTGSTTDYRPTSATATQSEGKQ